MADLFSPLTLYRRNLGKIERVVDISNLIEMQRESYARFLQKDMPAEERQQRDEVIDERFELRVTVVGHSGDEEGLPADMAIQHKAALARFLHSPVILKVFDENLRMVFAGIGLAKTDFDVLIIQRHDLGLQIEQIL